MSTKTPTEPTTTAPREEDTTADTTPEPDADTPTNPPTTTEKDATAQEEATPDKATSEEDAAPEEDSAPDRGAITEKDATAEKSGTSEKEAAGGARRSLTIAIPVPGRASLGRVLGVLVLVAALAVAGWQWRTAADLAAKEDTRARISSVAGRFGAALLSYRHGDLAAARARVLALATADFGRTYEVAFTETLQSTITELRADATATVRVVYVTGGDDGTARAVVVMDSQVKSSAGTRNVTGSYLQMDLVEQKGDWKVSAVNSIGAVNESLAATPDADPAASPSPEPSAP
ncbi:hypothetical protein LO762_09210 [Actinocorallia sp. API 0066]|uniref:hypothetical protein n=1 Tax=Actinocorallia sp. API 0066 TaxID=2896846 RepID=UPI001E4155B0|nr:hypothetical protein [Actinocorallia sp. API 0066]MCD0449366.1 hypothetical protein [Actinocorallia sp. API 0066]